MEIKKKAKSLLFYVIAVFALGYVAFDVGTKFYLHYYNQAVSVGRDQSLFDIISSVETTGKIVINYTDQNNQKAAITLVLAPSQTPKSK